MDAASSKPNKINTVAIGMAMFSMFFGSLEIGLRTQRGDHGGRCAQDRKQRGTVDSEGSRGGSEDFVAERSNQLVQLGQVVV